MLSKNPKTRARQKEEIILDSIWQKKVKDRDDWTCQICRNKLEKNNCQAHHIIPRGIKGMRWDVDNGITLCFPHHKVGLYSPHMNAVWFTFWLKTNKERQFRHVIKKLMELKRE